MKWKKQESEVEKVGLKTWSTGRLEKEDRGMSAYWHLNGIAYM